MERKEAIDFIKGNLRDDSHAMLREALETLVPELRESDGERIRKWIIEDIRYNMDEEQLPTAEYKRKAEEAIAWLEKQGGQKSEDRYTFKSIPRLLEMIKPTDTAKAYCRKLIDSLRQEGYSTDARIISQRLKLMNGEEVPLVTIDENQGESSKSDIECQPHECDPDNPYDMSFEDAQQYASERGIDIPINDGDIFADGRYITQTIGNILRWADMHPIQKKEEPVKPKFKVGDWVVSNRTSEIYKIDNIDAKDANYITYSCVPSIYTNEDLPCFNEDMIRLWSIQDAKDGDVLVNHNDEVPFIFRGFLNHDHPDWPVAYCGIDHAGEFKICPGNLSWEDSNVKPATKEQHDFLFSKMREARYEWDAGNKSFRLLL